MAVGSLKDFLSRAVSLLANGSLLGHYLHSQDFRTLFQTGGSLADPGETVAVYVYVCHVCTQIYIWESNNNSGNGYHLLSGC